MSNYSRNRQASMSMAPRPAGQHLHALILIGLAALLILLNLFFPSLVARVRITFMDVFTPFMHAASKPGEAVQGISSAWQDVSSIRDDNKKLQQQVLELRAWRDLAQQYADENSTLKGLLKYKDEAVTSFLTTRVVAEVGGNFNNSVIVTAGTRDGVIKNMIAMGEDGVVGRVIETGEWSSRVLLYTDISFRLPVMLEGTQQRAILTGQGSGFPKLLYIPGEVPVVPGTRVVTSGHGGLYPAYLPVGVVQERKGLDVFLNPFVKLNRLQTIRLVQYTLAGGDKNQLNDELKKASPDAAETQEKPVVKPAASAPPPKKPR